VRSKFATEARKGGFQTGFTKGERSRSAASASKMPDEREDVFITRWKKKRVSISSQRKEKKKIILSCANEVEAGIKKKEEKESKGLRSFLNKKSPVTMEKKEREGRRNPFLSRIRKEVNGKKGGGEMTSLRKGEHFDLANYGRKKEGRPGNLFEELPFNR